jgi:sporulation integral membrane protein YtvI
MRNLGKILAIPSLVFLFFFLIYLLAKFLLPFLLAGIIAFIIEPFVKKIQSLGLSRSLATAVSLLVFYFFSFGLLIWGLVVLGSEIMSASTQLPFYYATTIDSLESASVLIQEYFDSLPANTIPYMQQLLQEISGVGINFAKILGGWVFNVFYKAPMVLLVLVFMLLASYFISKEKELIFRWVFSFFSPLNQSRIKTIGKEIFESSIKFIWAQAILMTLTFAISIIGLSIAKVDYVLTISLVIAIFDILPIFGPGGIFAPWAIYLFITENTTTGFIILLTYAATFFCRQFMQPKVLSNTMSIPALPLLVCLWLGMILFGFTGLILAPFVLVVYKAIKNVQRDHLDFPDIPPEAE